MNEDRGDAPGSRSVGRTQTPPKDVLDALPDDVREIVIAAASRQGPLPPAAELAEYQQIYPPAAEEIFGMAKRDQAHRIEWEMTALRMTGRFTARGQYLGFAA